MKIKFIANAAATAFAICLMLVLAGPNAQAATSPALGAEGTFAIVSSTYTNTLNAGLETAIIGDTCYTTGPATAPISYSSVPSTPCAPATGTAQTAALADLNAQANAVTCTNLGPTATLNAVDVDGAGPLPPGTFPPGCYKTDTTMNITLGTTVTLSGAGTYIFRPGGALTTGANSKVVLADGASSCDVFWAPIGATTLGANAATSATPTFVGTIFQDALNAFDATLGHFAHLQGRVLAFGRTVTTDSNTIDSTCLVAPVTPVGGGGRGNDASINVVKVVINDNGGTKKVSDFPLFVNDTPVVSGETNYFPAPADAYWITETKNPNYVQSFSGDCDRNGSLGAYAGDNYFCVITNDDIGPTVVVPPVPPFIDVVKVPSPLNLPNGPGMVNYTYTLRNIGTVPVTDITMVGDSCSPITLASGDTNSNGKLEVTETWKYTCSKTVSETTTNTVTATGWANGISAIDIASATVVVGPQVPPLIHVKKVPTPHSLPAGGGTVTYSEEVTNPGTVTLNNVVLKDDKCAPMRLVSGDTNSNGKLEVTETWRYTCRTNLANTTTNTAKVTGEANGYKVTDVAIATVPVATAIPKLPNTGSPAQMGLVWPLVAGGLLIVSLLLYIFWKKKAV